MGGRGGAAGEVWLFLVAVATPPPGYHIITSTQPAVCRGTPPTAGSDRDWACAERTGHRPTSVDQSRIAPSPPCPATEKTSN